MEVTNLLEISSREELYRWYLENHDKVREFWIRVNRSGKPDHDVIGYIDAVEVALCFGWIDSTLKSIDDGKPVQRFSPRKKGGNWNWKNRERCRRLVSMGEMTPYGEAVMPDINPESFIFPDWFIDAFKEDATVWHNFRNLPDAYKRIKADNILRFIDTGRRGKASAALHRFVEDTREGRMQKGWDDGGRLK